MSTSGSRAPGALAQLEHLAGDHVEERLPVLGLDQRLGVRHAHARAEPAVELEDDRLVERRVLVGQLVEVLRGRSTGSISDSGSMPVSPSASCS